jgi:cytochrome c oxidase cbb3-type subunit 4
MNVFSVIASATTVLSFVAFIGILAWACSRRNAARFAAAAQAPFALPDETVAEAARAADRRTA